VPELFERNLAIIGGGSVAIDDLPPRQAVASIWGVASPSVLA
jgi:hypothetical protein